MANSAIHARVDGPVVMVGFGSIGRGGLPLILRHLAGGTCLHDRIYHAVA